MIGVMHIGFGIILGLMNIVYSGVLGFASLTFISGYPFWGGVSVSTLLEHLFFSVYKIELSPAYAQLMFW